MALIPSKRMRPARLSKIRPPEWLENKKGVNILNTNSLSVSGVAMGILAVVAGILVLIRPELVRWIIGIYLIVWGILAIINKK